MGKIITNESFIKEVSQLLNPTVELVGSYISSTQKILCRCKECGHEWESLPSNLKKGKGCPKCAIKNNANNKKIKAQEKLLSYVSNCDFKIIGEYVDAKTPIHCKCSICNHEWYPFPGNILKGQGCPECGNKSKSKKLSKSKEDVENKLPDNIELINYIRSGEKALFRCKVCSHEWFAIPSNVINKQSGCPKCSGRIKTDKEFKKELLKINPNITVLENYKTAITKLKCSCNKCGNTWEADPHHLLRGQGCPKCSKSKGELFIQSFLDSQNVSYTSQYCLLSDFPRKIFIDFRTIINDKEYYIEYNGIQHYQPVEYFGGVETFKKQQERDNFLKEYCIDNNINLIEVKYDMKEYEIKNLLYSIIENNEYNNIADKLAVEASHEFCGYEGQSRL